MIYITCFQFLTKFSMKEIKGSNFDNKAACDCFYYLFIFNFEFFELLGNWIIASGIWANIHRGKQFIYKQTVTKWFHTLTRCSCFCYIVIKTIWFNIKCVFATILKIAVHHFMYFRTPFSICYAPYFMYVSLSPFKEEWWQFFKC